MLEIPAIEDARSDRARSRSARFPAARLVFLDQIEDALRAGEDIGMDRRRFIELKHLRHITDDEVAPLIEFASVRLHHACGDLEKSGFAGTVASDQANALALQNRQRGAIEHGLIAKADDEFGRAGDGVENRFGHPLQ